MKKRTGKPKKTDKIARRKSAGVRRTAVSGRTASTKKTQQTSRKSRTQSQGPAPVDVMSRKPEEKRLNKGEKQEIKEMLLSMRRRLTGQIAALKDDSLQRTDSVNSEEDGTDAFDRQFALNLASSENDVVYAIDEALERIDNGTYGVCEQCGQRVEIARLKALPFVQLCIRCKTENEKNAPRRLPAEQAE